jgi:large-conductance mechanosensitive channel
MEDAHLQRTKDIMNFILSERLCTITVLGSIFTFAFVSSLKNDIIDPLLRILFPEEFYGFMDVVIREGEKMQKAPMQVEVRMGNFFREFVTWIILISILFILAKYTRFPDHVEGNSIGAAVV